ncbi:hypothetical protein NMG60_11020651 [Bertholletia excelsa]
MDRVRPVYVKPRSTDNSGGGGTAVTPTGISPLSAMIQSPLQRHSRSGSAANLGRKPQSAAATKAAAARLAQMMSSQSPDDDDSDEDDLLYEPASTANAGRLCLAGGKAPATSRPRPVSVRTANVGQPTPVRLSSVDQQPPPARPAPVESPTASQPTSTEQRQPSPSRPTGSAAFPAQSPRRTGSVEPPQPLSARSISPSQHAEQAQPPSARANRTANTTEQPVSARSASAGRPSLGAKSVPIIPPSVPIKLRTQASIVSAETPPDRKVDRRLSVDMGSMNLRESGPNLSTSALQDELDMLQEENESLHAKLRLAEEKFEEADARARQLEKQVANLGEGVSLEARLLSRKEAALQQREAALKAATQTYGSSNEEIQALRMEVEFAREEAVAAQEQLLEVASENKSLQTATQRLMLTQEEMEEVVLKRCWLARYWNLCVRYGIYGEIATARSEYWSSYAPLPVDVVLAAGQRAKDEVNSDTEEREKVLHDLNQLSGEGNVESMLFVEKGLRELSSLKVEEAVAIAMAQERLDNSGKSGTTAALVYEAFSSSAP